jgi:hypothetical protein
MFFGRTSSETNGSSVEIGPSELVISGEGPNLERLEDPLRDLLFTSVDMLCSKYILFRDMLKKY